MLSIGFYAVCKWRCDDASVEYQSEEKLYKRVELHESWNLNYGTVYLYLHVATTLRNAVSSVTVSEEVCAMYSSDAVPCRR